MKDEDLHKLTYNILIGICNLLPYYTILVRKYLRVNKKFLKDLEKAFYQYLKKFGFIAITKIQKKLKNNKIYEIPLNMF